ncbi:MAG TPA: ABC transporter ATP-binding protein [Ferruginibacter sp.]|nr:ABC transporter ATP-binding protein [Ferruginibacter sp.]
MKIYRRLLAYGKPFKGFILSFFPFTLLATFFSVFQLAMLIPLLNFLFYPNTVDAHLYLSIPKFSFSSAYFLNLFYYYVNYFKNIKPIYALFFMSSIVMSAVIFSNLFDYLAELRLIQARTLLVKRLREAIFEKINYIQLGYFTKENKGDLLSRLNSDVFEIENVASNAADILFKEPYLMIGYFILLFSISVKLTLFTLLIIPASATAIALVQKKLKKEATAAQSSVGRLLTIVDETLTGMRIIRSFNATKFVLKRFSDENDVYRRATLRGFAKKQLAPAFSEISGVMMVAAILIYSGRLILDHDAAALDAGKFVVFIAVFSQVIRPAKSMVAAMSNIQRGQAAGERVLHVLDTPVTILDKPNAVELKSFTDKIEFKNICFSYTDKQIIDNISFTIPKGKTTAIVGPSGVGKSTIADLLPRFYDVTNGCILIDGKDIRDVTMESLRSPMSFVTQDTFLFNDTIFNNIALGKPDATEEQVMQAAKIANAHEFIIQTEDGYHTNIGDRGVRLSGGQRQRLSIARAVFKNPEILILDEATSALDTESERLVQSALSNLMKGRTTLVIAHRLSTIQQADEILVLQDGKIIEKGNHQQLVEIENGNYQRLIKLQEIA